jgi:5'-methylthioadenosine phosphorylase
MKKHIRPGDFVIPHDFFDATRSRSLSFFDEKRIHVDMTDPFCPTLRKLLVDTCNGNSDLTVHQQGVYVTTEGPRLETLSEIRFYATIGDLVGMTLVPEIVLAREKGLCFTSLCLVCNMAAGLQKALPADDIKHIFREKESHLSEILKDVLENISQDFTCECKQKYRDAVL